jgi:SAM-dependent methyltransferase
MMSTDLTRDVEHYAQRHPQLADRRNIPGLLARALEEASGPLLDVGCGEGGTLHALAPLTTHSGVGLEYSFIRASRAITAKTPIALGDALDVPVRNGSVGLVISRHVIEHIADDCHALREIHRTLRVDGLLYLETPIRWRGAWYRYRNAAGQRVLDPTHVREYRSEAAVSALVTEAGFALVDREIVPLRYPLLQIAHRLLRPHQTSTRFIRTWLERPTPSVRIPRYSEIRLLARRLG